MSDRYDIILSDPPWSFSSTAGGGSRRDAGNQYDLMSVAEIKALDPFVAEQAAAISVLFLWVPDSQLPAGIEVMNAWGYRYVKSALVWVKLTQKALTPPQLARELKAQSHELVLTKRYGARKLAFGAGRTTRNGTETCLLGARGSLPVQNHSQRQVIHAPIREHSRKPDEQYERIEAMYPRKRYLEMFARKHNARPGWARWGNEA